MPRYSLAHTDYLKSATRSAWIPAELADNSQGFDAVARLEPHADVPLSPGLCDTRRSADGRFLTGGAIERAHRVVVEALLSQGLSVTEIGQALVNTSPAARVG